MGKSHIIDDDSCLQFCLLFFIVEACPLLEENLRNCCFSVVFSTSRVCVYLRPIVHKVGNICYGELDG
jgi:hypothetical protein